MTIKLFNKTFLEVSRVNESWFLVLGKETGLTMVLGR
jgi:hypothetical protein